MQDIQDIPRSRLDELERHEMLTQAIRDKSAQLGAIHERYGLARASLRDTVAEAERLQADLLNIGVNGLPKQVENRMPFGGGSDAAAIDDGTIPPEIDALPVTKPQKQALVSEGIGTLLDIVEIEFGNWTEVGSLDEIVGFGPFAVSKVRDILPNTAPVIPVDKNRPEHLVRMVRVLNSSGEPAVKNSFCYRATIRDDGKCFIEVPFGGVAERHEFDDGEYEVVQ